MATASIANLGSRIQQAEAAIQRLVEISAERAAEVGTLENQRCDLALEAFGNNNKEAQDKVNELSSRGAELRRRSMDDRRMIEKLKQDMAADRALLAAEQRRLDREALKSFLEPLAKLGSASRIAELAEELKCELERQGQADSAAASRVAQLGFSREASEIMGIGRRRGDLVAAILGDWVSTVLSRQWREQLRKNPAEVGRGPFVNALRAVEAALAGERAA